MTQRANFAQEIDPGTHGKAQKAAKAERAENRFEVVAREWFAKYQPTWASSHADKIINRLENDVFPWMGDRPIAEITAPEALAIQWRLAEKGALKSLSSMLVDKEELINGRHVGGADALEAWLEARAAA